MNILYKIKKSHHLSFGFCSLAVKTKFFHYLLPELHYSSNYISICKTFTWYRDVGQKSSTSRKTAEMFTKENAPSSAEK